MESKKNWNFVFPFPGRVFLANLRRKFQCHPLQSVNNKLIEFFLNRIHFQCFKYAMVAC